MRCQIVQGRKKCYTYSAWNCEVMLNNVFEMRIADRPPLMGADNDVTKLSEKEIRIREVNGEGTHDQLLFGAASSFGQREAPNNIVKMS